MRDLPSGTVTFLFTDIEGSTKLLHELGDDYAEALASHRHVLRQAFADYGGAEVDTQGDAFLVAFARAKKLWPRQPTRRHSSMPPTFTYCLTTSRSEVS